MPDETDLEASTGGPDRAPRSFSGVIGRAGLAAATLVAVAAVIYVLSARLPSGTGTGALVTRGLIGFGIGAALVFVVRRMMRALGEAPPAPPQRIDARLSDVVYECPICGTRVRLEVASTVKAPKHCGEEMEARLG